MGEGYCLAEEGDTMSATDELTPRQETLLVFLGADNNTKLDPVRIMKGLFIFAMEAPENWLPSAARYNFEPYNYGPYSPDIYYDLERLERQGYVETAEVPGRSWKHYSLTPDGVKLAQGGVSAINPKVANYLRVLREFVDGLSFRQLLTAVYDKYPDYAVNSVFKT